MRLTDLLDGGGRDVAATVTLSDGTGFLVGERLRPLRPGRTYQLWVLVQGRSISLGVLGRDPHLSAFHYATRGGEFAITEEVVPGATTRAAHLVARGTRP